MNPSKTEKLFSLMKQYGVEYLKTTEVEIRIGNLNHTVNTVTSPGHTVNTVSSPGPESAAAAPPTEMQIPHHENQVAKLLKLNDEQLVDAMFPEGAPINADS
jgi:hypothetical protein